MKKILILTDLLESSVNAYRYALELAEARESEILLVFCSNGEAISLESHLQYTQRLHGFAKRYAGKTRQRDKFGLPVECLISNDKWIDAIPSLLTVHQPELVVAGAGILEEIQMQEQVGECELLNNVLFLDSFGKRRPKTPLLNSSSEVD